ncbi:LRRCT [Chamberlinius hualienensis]
MSRNYRCIQITCHVQHLIQCKSCSCLNMGSILPLFLTILLYWNLIVRAKLSAASSCPKDCQCRWKYGKETVECVGRDLAAIPNGISEGTQVLDLSDNKFQSFAKDTFQEAKLTNLQRIFLARCNIEVLHDGAFNRLTNLIELDLSNNNLPAVPTNTFKDIPGLRKLILNSNPIRRLENYAFSGLTSLGTLELSRCEIESVSTKAFHGLKGLTYLKLDNNRLTSLSGKSVQPLKGLHGVDLHGNLWRCDCSMQDVKLWLTKFNIPHKAPAVCNEPARTKDKSLDDLQLDDLACQPQSIYSNRRTEVTVGHNASLVCEVTSNPTPAFQWQRNGVPLVNLTRSTKGVQMYVMYERNTGAEKASILTITSVAESDAGLYVCIAENKAGRFTANFTLEVTYRDLEASGLTGGQIAGISLGLIVVGGIVLLLICILLSKWRNLEHRGVNSKHPPLNQSQHKLVNCNNTNHVNYHNKSNHGDNSGAGNKVKNSVVNMSFALPRSLSRSSSVATQRNNFSDEAASDSDRTMVENLTSPSKSSTCNLSNKPDVVNVESRREKDNLRSRRHNSDGKKNGNKDRRKERRKSKEEAMMTTSSDEPVDTSNGGKCNANLQCNSNSYNTGSSGKTKKVDNDARIRMEDDNDDDDEGVVVDNRYGSFGNLKLSASSEWNKVTADMIENTGYARDCADGLLQECYELVVQKGALPPPTHQHLSSSNKLDNPSMRNDHNNLSSPSSTNEIHRTINSTNEDDDGNTIFKNNTSAGNKSANPRFRHYVPVLPPLPAQHYTNVRNSLIRPYFGNEEMTLVEDKTDM